ncbi:MAG: ABC transporter permease, partial [Proteobacteria bacterium]|nr:ABC transporter permease [Pseudomonadota bacterium]
MISPLNRRRLAIFKANRRGYISLLIFCVLFFISLFAEFIANDKPLIVLFDGDLLFPVLRSYQETRFGGEFETEADYRDEYVAQLIEKKGRMLWPPIRYSYDT